MCLGYLRDESTNKHSFNQNSNFGSKFDILFTVHFQIERSGSRVEEIREIGM